MPTCELRLPMQVHAQYHLAAFRPYKGCSIFFFEEMAAPIWQVVSAPSVYTTKMAKWRL